MNVSSLSVGITIEKYIGEYYSWEYYNSTTLGVCYNIRLVPMQPVLSIVIPTLNEEGYLPRLLADLSQQKVANFEVIIVDSSSNSRTEDAAFATKHPFPLFFHKVAKQNVAYQKNEGAKKAQGTYLIFLDADSQVHTDFIQGLTKALTKKPGLVYRPYTLPDDKDYLEMETLFFIYNIVAELSFLTSNPLGDGGCLIFTKHFFIHIGGFDEKVQAEDYDIMRRCVEWGVRPRFITNVKVVMSLRRIRREDKLKLLFKHTFVTFSNLVKLEVKRGTITYDMGGGVIQEAHLSKNKQEALKKLLSKDYLKSARSLFRKILEA